MRRCAFHCVSTMSYPTRIRGIIVKYLLCLSDAATFLIVFSLLDLQRRAKQRNERKRKKARKDGEEVEPTGQSAVNLERRMVRPTKTKLRCQNKLIYLQSKEEHY